MKSYCEQCYCVKKLKFSSKYQDGKYFALNYQDVENNSFWSNSQILKFHVVLPPSHFGLEWMSDQRHRFNYA